MFVHVDPPPSVFRPSKIDDVIDLFYDFESLHVSLKPLGCMNKCISIIISEWLPTNKNTYLAFRLATNLNNIEQSYISIVEGAMCIASGRILDTECFLNIKNDPESIRSAIRDIKTNSVRFQDV